MLKDTKIGKDVEKTLNQYIEEYQSDLEYIKKVEKRISKGEQMSKADFYFFCRTLKKGNDCITRLVKNFQDLNVASQIMYKSM